MNMSSLGPLSWHLHLARWLWSTEMVGVGHQNFFLFVRVLKWYWAEEGDFPHVVLPVSLTGTCRSQKFGDGVCMKGLWPLIPHVNIAQVCNTCCRHGCDPNASHTGGRREKWGVTLEGDQNVARYTSSVISFSSVTLYQHRTVMAKVRHVVGSGRSWTFLSPVLYRDTLRLPVWHLKRGTWNDYLCLFSVWHFCTIMWTESSDRVKQSSDNLYLLYLDPFHHLLKASLLPQLSSSRTEL